uniref:Ketopantoate reductase C-terminal domain-containing protein n=1 Tax=Phakopsora pachyrhizi TaxID=170000 RepID=A0A0S1MJC9_PHAPC
MIDELVHQTNKDSRSLVELLKEGGIRDAEMHGEKELQVLRWHKLAVNASMNPTSILSGGLTNSEMVQKSHLRNHLRETMNEILEAGRMIFKIQDYPSKFATPDQILDSTERASNSEGIRKVLGGEDKTIIKPSMLIDWENGRELEVEAILGLPAKIARNFGVKLSRVETMYSLLVELQKARDHRNSIVKTSKI